LNNIGVLRLDVGKVKEAQDAFEKAIKNSKKLQKLRPDDTRLRAIEITSKFNLAYWHEQHHQYGEAS